MTTQVEAWSLAVNAFESDQKANAEPETMLAWLGRDYPAGTGPGACCIWAEQIAPPLEIPLTLQL